MTIQLEVCIDNLESLHNAQQAGATRIELCSSLALGGLTPSAGFMSAAAKYATIPVYAMIRPRQGDFLFSSDDVEIMLADIFAAKQAHMGSADIDDFAIPITGIANIAAVVAQLKL